MKFFGTFFFLLNHTIHYAIGGIHELLRPSNYNNVPLFFM